jgi:hypothetical protein
MIDTPTPIIHPHAKRWQELGDEFHMMVGYYIAVWAYVDDALFQVFRECLGPLDQSAAIYFKMPGLDARFSLTAVRRQTAPTERGKASRSDPQALNFYRRLAEPLYPGLSSAVVMQRMPPVPIATYCST